MRPSRAPPMPMQRCCRTIDTWCSGRDASLALDEAEAFVGAMPAGKEGLLFLADGQPMPVQPNPEKLADYVEHAGRRGGYWPSSAEIGAQCWTGTSDVSPAVASEVRAVRRNVAIDRA